MWVSGSVYGHSLTGMTGLLNVPSADVQTDGTVIFGASYLDKNHAEVLNSKSQYNVLAYYVNVTFLPFAEVALRSSGPLNRPDRSFQVDRMVSARIQLLKEQENIPSFVIGGHDIITTVNEGNQYFGALYTVTTKHLNLSEHDIGLTLGYGLDIMEHNQFEGLFGGLSFSPSFIPEITVMVEYDSNVVNIGGELSLFDHIELLSVLQDMKDFSGSIAVKVFL